MARTRHHQDYSCWHQRKPVVHLVARGLFSMMLHYATVNTVVLLGLTGMHETDCSGGTRLVLLVPSSS